MYRFALLEYVGAIALRLPWVGKKMAWIRLECTMRITDIITYYIGYDCQWLLHEMINRISARVCAILWSMIRHTHTSQSHTRHFIANCCTELKKQNSRVRHRISYLRQRGVGRTVQVGTNKKFTSNISKKNNNTRTLQVCAYIAQHITCRMRTIYVYMSIEITDIRSKWNNCAGIR